MLTGNTEWNARADSPDQAPVYYVTVDGISSTKYSTALISASTGTVKLILGLPEIQAGAVDLLDGSWTTTVVRIPFYDVAGEASTLFRGAGGLVPSWKNRKVTLWGGYRDIPQSSYIQLFTGRVTGLTMLEDVPAAGYVLELSDSSYLLDGELCTAATETTPATIRGNVVNVFASLLRGVFSTTDADFPLEFVSTAGASSSAPTGLGVPDALLDFVGMKAERDTWRPGDTVELTLEAPTPAKNYLRAEFFRVFQARLNIRGDGLLGFRFNVPALPAAAAPAVTLETVAAVDGWEQSLADHLNKFTVRGDHDLADGSFVDLYTESTTEDTDDRTATSETVEYVVESKWIRSAYDGIGIARELAGRLRQLWLPMPGRARLAVTFRQRRLEAGDVVALTHPDIPDQRLGLRGVTSRLMVILRAVPDLRAGLIVLELLDASLRRYGVISPSSASGDYSTADTAARNTFFFVCNGSGLMPVDDGYRFI